LVNKEIPACTGMTSFLQIPIFATRTT